MPAGRSREGIVTVHLLQETKCVHLRMPTGGTGNDVLSLGAAELHVAVANAVSSRKWSVRINADRRIDITDPVMNACRHEPHRLCIAQHVKKAPVHVKHCLCNRKCQSQHVSKNSAMMFIFIWTGLVSSMADRLSLNRI